MKKIISAIIMLSMLLGMSVGVRAESGIQSNIHELTDNILISGTLSGTPKTECVTVIIMKDSELKYIKEFPLNKDGSYECKFKFIPDAGTDISDYSLKVNAGGLNATESVISVTDGALYEFETEYTNQFGDKIIDFTGKVKARVKVKNKYADMGSVPMYFASYDNGIFKGLQSGKAEFGFSVNQEIELSKTLDAALTNSKFMLWNGYAAMVPFAAAKELKRQTYGADKLSKTAAELTESGDKITIVALAASVTQGAHAGNDGSDHENTNITEEALHSYGWIGRTVKAYFEEKYGAGNVEYLSAAIGGTNTRQALYRLQKDVLSEKPDVVFVDTPINDSWDDPSYDPGLYSEAIIRQLLKTEHQPVIILNQTAGFTKSGDTRVLDQTRKNTSTKTGLELATKYELPFINFFEFMENVSKGTEGKYLTVDGVDYSAKITDQNSCWDTLFYDGVHPNKIGHGVYANYAVDVLGKKNLTNEKHTKTFGKPIYGYEYNNPHMISWKQAKATGMATWSDGWYEEEAGWGQGYTSTNFTVSDGKVWEDGCYKTINAGESVTFKFKGTSIGIYARRGAAFGADYSIDGGEITGSFTNSGSSLYWVPWELHGLSDGEHTITITTTGTDELKNNTNPNKHFTIAYFLVDCE